MSISIANSAEPVNKKTAEEQEISPPRADAAYAVRMAALEVVRRFGGFSEADLDGHLDAAGHVDEMRGME